MAFKPNYRMQRSDRNRAKELKQKEKLARRTEASEKRKAERDGVPVPEGAEGVEGKSAGEPDIV